jgi:hypothetical protein
VRWAQTVERIHYELPAGHELQSACNGMMSELALDDLQDALEAALAAMVPAEPNPFVTEAAREVYQLQRDWNGLAAKIRDAQPWLRRAAGDWRHTAVLRDLTADMFQTPKPYPTSVDERQQFSSIEQARQAAKAMFERVSWLRSLVSQIDAAQSFDRADRAEQAADLIRSFALRRQESDARIIALEAAVGALQAQLRRRTSRRSKPRLEKAA